LGNFLTGLGERLGVDLTAAAEGLGLDVNRFTSPRSNNDSDFEPRTDIFDTASNYTIHVSVPGAKKSDVGVEWDGEHSILRVTGVVHRPGVDEEMMSHLVVDGRKRETGVFEKNIRLGTQAQPAAIDVSGIAAKMADGVLVVTVPKIQKKPFQKKEVRINSPVEEQDMNMDEGDVDVDVDVHERVATGDDQDMYNAESTHHDTTPYPAKATASASSSTSSKATEKQKEAEREAHRDDRSETVGPNATVETLPRYEPEDNTVHDGHNHQTRSPNHAKVADEEEMNDWEKAGSDEEGEGEFIKINVD
jgi:HSP20 family protein